MANIATIERTKSASEAPLKLDAAVIGAGVAGLYQCCISCAAKDWR